MRHNNPYENVIQGKETSVRLGMFNATQNTRSRPLVQLSAGRALLIAGLALFASAAALAQEDDQSEERSEEHTSELQSRPHISYAVFCLKKKNTNPIPFLFPFSPVYFLPP